MLEKFFKRHIYVQLSPERVTVRDPKTQQFVSEVPEVAISRSSASRLVVLAVGSAARGSARVPNTEICNPFAHPRSLVSDFTVASCVLKAFFSRVRGKSPFQLKPVVVIHPLGEHNGGLTQVELRAFRELALVSGAKEVHIWQGPRLTDEQVISGDFPLTGSLLSE